MDALKLIILLCCTYQSVIATATHNIPVGEYKTELQDLGQHVEYPETPVKVIKITKTIAVKIPVPYPVKVVEKVPYPVHISKPYPVPVPQIVHVPTPTGHGSPSGKMQAVHGEPAVHGGYGAPVAGHGGFSVPAGYGHEDITGTTGGIGYGVHEGFASQNGNSGFSPHEGFSNPGSLVGHSGPAANEDHHFAGESAFHGSSGDQDGGSLEAKSYDEAFNEYLKSHGAAARGSSHTPYH